MLGTLSTIIAAAQACRTRRLAWDAWALFTDYNGYSSATAAILQAAVTATTEDADQRLAAVGLDHSSRWDVAWALKQHTSRW